MQRVFLSAIALLFVSPVSDVLAQQCNATQPRVRVRSNITQVIYAIDSHFSSDGAGWGIPGYASREHMIAGFNKWNGKKGITVQPTPPAHVSVSIGFHSCLTCSLHSPELLAAMVWSAEILGLLRIGRPLSASMEVAHGKRLRMSLAISSVWMRTTPSTRA